MVVLRFMVHQLGTLLSNETQWAAMRSLVADLENSELSGKDRKAKVIADFEAIGYDIAGWLLETLLQLALLYVRGI